MRVTRWVDGLLLACVTTGAASAQTYPLTETPRANDCYRVQLGLKLDGAIKVVQEGKPVEMKLAAFADHRFTERVLAVLPNGLVGKSARSYEASKSTITRNGTPAAHELRPERRLTVAQRPADALLCYSPQGPLTREEIELVSEHFDTLALAGLLPGKDVKVGDTWKPGNACVQALCQFEGLLSHDLVATLDSAKDGVASVSIKGAAKGIDIGAQVSITVEAVARFDLNAKCLTALDWKQKDDRDQGPASPAIAASASVTLRREKVEQAKDLSDVALVGVPSGYDVPVTLTQVYHRDAKDRFDLAVGREWQPVGQTPEHMILRLMERGDFIAQLTVTPWDKAAAGQHLKPDELKDAVLRAPGWEVEEILQEGEVPGENGRWVYRVTARGEMDGVKVVQTFFLVAGPKGDQVVLAFTMKQSQVGKLGARDLAVVESVDFPASRGEK